MRKTLTANESKTIRKMIWRKKSLYIMMIPTLVYFFCFKYLPMAGSVIAFRDYSFRKGIWKSPWASPWYKYFLQFFESPYFKQILSNTLIISTLKIAITIPCAVIFAIALNEVTSKRYSRVVQIVTFLPHFLSWVIVYGILYAMLSETNGLVNFVIRQITGNTVNFLSDPKTFRALVIFSEVWKETGYNSIVYLAAIIGIDTSLYDAAKVDGAGRWRCIWHVTLPGIQPVTIIMLLLSIGTVLEAGFEQIYTLYNERVYQVGDVIDTWVYRTGMKEMSFELASAVGLFKSLIGMALLFAMNSLARKWDESLW